MRAHRRPILAFGEFTLDAAERRLSRRGERVDLGGKPLELLELLLTYAPRLVTRDEIRAALWPDRVIEYDAAINAAIRDIRHALGDDPKAPRYVETVPRHGYRFLAPLSRRANGARRRALAFAAAGATAVAVLSVIGIGMLATPEETDPRLPSDAARAAFIKAEHLLSTHEAGDPERAIPLLEEAVSVDPRFADAWAALADAYYYSYDHPDRTMPAAAAAVEKALALDPLLARAHRRLADIEFSWHWRFDNAEAAYRRALELDPGAAETHHAYAAFLIATGHEDDAFAHMARALAIDPLSTVLHGDLAWFYAIAGRHEAALAECELLLELAPDNRRAIACPLRSLLALGRLEAAAQVAKRLMPASAAGGDLPADQLASYWQWRLEGLQAALDEGRFVDPVVVALVQARAGNPVRAIEWIEQAHDARSRLLVYVHLYPEFRALHDHPRFIGDGSFDSSRIAGAASARWKPRKVSRSQRDGS